MALPDVGRGVRSWWPMTPGTETRAGPVGLPRIMGVATADLKKQIKSSCQPRINIWYGVVTT